MMENAFSRLCAGGGCLPTPTHAIKPIKLNWCLISWIVHVSLAFCLISILSWTPGKIKLWQQLSPSWGPPQIQVMMRIIYDGDNSETLNVDSQLWREECFRKAEEKLDRSITALLMNLATLVSNMDDVCDLADSMRIPRKVATQLVTTCKPVMVTMLQLYTSCNYHILVVWY